MTNSPDPYDLIIIGAGPCGLAAGIEAQKQGLSYLILEKGGLTESIRKYPVQMTFFSTTENIAIGDIPFSCVNPRASRSEALAYYREVVKHFGLNIRLYSPALAISGSQGNFQVETPAGVLNARNIVVATGYFDRPRRLGIPGEDLPHVSSYYTEAAPHAFTDVVIIGGGNSAVQAALDLYRNHARVTMIVRKPEVKPSVKYWIRPDFDNRVKEGNIRVFTNTQAIEITSSEIVLLSENQDIPKRISATSVLKLIGYDTDRDFLGSMGIAFGKDYIPEHDPETFETNVPGIFLVGTVTAGVRTERVFIENGRLHARPVIDRIVATI